MKPETQDLIVENAVLMTFGSGPGSLIFDPVMAKKLRAVAWEAIDLTLKEVAKEAREIVEALVPPSLSLNLYCVFAEQELPLVPDLATVTIRRSEVEMFRSQYKSLLHGAARLLGKDPKKLKPLDFVTAVFEKSIKEGSSS